MPTLCLPDADKFSFSESIENPTTCDWEFPLGGFTIYLTGHMLTSGKLISSIDGFKKYYDYRVGSV